MGFETDQAVIRFLALRSALEIIQRMRSLQCEFEHGVRGKTGSVGPLLTAQDEIAVKRHILNEYQTFLQEDDAKWHALATDVGQAIRLGQTTDTYVGQLLDKYVAPRADAGQLSAERCACLKKIAASCGRSQQ